MHLKLPDLPYAQDALMPFISADTLAVHHGKHHRGYVDKVNAAIEKTSLAGKALEQIVRHAREQDDTDLFNNAAQAWNHEFLWNSMSPNGGRVPSSELQNLIDKSFSGLDGFREEFRRAATSQFGSGWAWLVMDGGDLKIIQTANAETPVGTEATPLLTLDVWEHAYYLDYRNDRGAYVDGFLSGLINWEFADFNLERMRKAA